MTGLFYLAMNIQHTFEDYVQHLSNRFMCTFYYVTNTLQLPSFLLCSTYFFWLNGCIVTMLIHMFHFILSHKYNKKFSINANTTIYLSSISHERI